MVDLIHLFSQYELLELAAQSLSTLDLYHTALTCSTLYTLIRTPDAKFQRLKRVNTCDGKGLAARQESPKVWATIHALVNSLSIPKAEIKVRIFEDCNGRGALPCIKCGINVCEDCRVFPREKHEWGPRRPHCNDQAQMFNIVCFCEACDEEVAAKIPGEDYCQCDIYTRWICRKCKWEEGKEEVWYRKHWTQMYCGGEPEVAGAGTTLPDDQQERMYWCPCGVRAPRVGNIRCIWCKKKHKTEVKSCDWHEDGRVRTYLVMEEDGFWQPSDGSPN